MENMHFEVLIILHLGYVVAQPISHQASDTHVGVLHADPYSTQARSWDGRLRDMERWSLVGGTVPLTITILRAMRMVHL